MGGSESPWKALTLVSVVGMDIAAGVLAGVWLGRKLDNMFGTSPWGLVIGVFLGMGAGILIIIPVIKKFLGDQSNER